MIPTTMFVNNFNDARLTEPGPIQNTCALFVSGLSNVEIFIWIVAYWIFILLRQRKFVKE